MSHYEAHLCDSSGVRLEEVPSIPIVAFSGVLKFNDYSVLVTEVGNDFPRDQLVQDRILEVWRAPDGGKLKFLAAGFLRKWRFEEVDDLLHIVMTVYTGEYILDGRIVAYYAGSSQAAKTDFADDMGRAIVRENMLSSATDTTRNLTANNFSTGNDISTAPSISKSFSWRNALAVLQDICKSSAEAGNDLYFWVEASQINATQIGWRFTMKVDYPGIDRGSTSSEPITFSPKQHNLIDGYIEFDYTDERNYIYTGGQGEGASRTIIEVSDTVRIAQSAWNRREAFADARNESTTDGLLAKGYEVLNAAKPIVTVGGKLADGPNSIYGIDWELGDKVVVEFYGYIFDVVVTSAMFNYSATTEQETILGRFDVL